MTSLWVVVGMCCFTWRWEIGVRSRGSSGRAPLRTKSRFSSRRRRYLQSTSKVPTPYAHIVSCTSGQETVLNHICPLFLPAVMSTENHWAQNPECITLLGNSSPQIPAPRFKQDTNSEIQNLQKWKVAQLKSMGCRVFNVVTEQFWRIYSSALFFGFYTTCFCQAALQWLPYHHGRDTHGCDPASNQLRPSYSVQCTEQKRVKVSFISKKVLVITHIK